MQIQIVCNLFLVDHKYDNISKTLLITLLENLLVLVFKPNKKNVFCNNYSLNFVFLGCQSGEQFLRNHHQSLQELKDFAAEEGYVKLFLDVVKCMDSLKFALLNESAKAQ